MAVTIVYKADSVGPVCRKFKLVDPSIRVTHEDDLEEETLRAVTPRQLPAPPDPIIQLWEDTQAVTTTLNRAFTQGTYAARQYNTDALINVLQRLQNAQRIPAPIAPPPIAPERNILVRWGSRWEGNADLSINSADSVDAARDKRTSRTLMGALAPATWLRADDVQLPCIVRPRHHHAGTQFHVCHANADLRTAIRRCGFGWYASPIIQKQREFRVFVLHGRVIRVSEKLPPTGGGIAWNLGAGGGSRTLKRATWPMEAIRVAVAATKAVGLDWAATDVAVDTTGKAVVFEVNTAPGLNNMKTIGKIATALTWTTTHPLPTATTAWGGWKDVIHPALLADV
mgnify:FL=1